MALDRKRNDPRRRAALTQMNNLAWLLDNSIPIPILNYRIGLDALIGLIPGLGDVAGLLVSSLIVVGAIRLGVPPAIVMRMLLNLVIEAVIGLIPVLGDLFDATFKANVRNVQLLTLALDPTQPGYTASLNQSRGVVVATIAALIAVLVLIVGAGVALFWATLAFFTQ
jgi:hypothetical protein